MNAADLDRNDELAPFRDRFVIADPDLIYLDGNSLGRLPKATVERLRGEVERVWGSELCRAWGDWFELPQRLGAKIAGVVGAKAHEVLCCDSTSVNFYKLVTAALTMQKGRTKIVTDDLNFPSDLYLLQGCVAQNPGTQIEVVKSPDGIHLPPEEIEARLDENTALLTLSHVSFKSGFLHDMARLTKKAHAMGVLVLWDLSHAVGAVPIELGEADFAVGCTYKYLNGGPGSPAFLYVNEKHHEDAQNPIWGWFGQRKPFDFGLEYQPAEGMNGMLIGTPPILSMLGVEAGVDLVAEAGLDRIRAKSLKLTAFMVEQWREHLAPLGMVLRTPEDPAQRGSHIALAHPEAYPIDRALIEAKKVIPDFRAPDNIRFGFSPLYTTFAEIEEAVRRTKEVITSGIYEGFRERTEGVT